MDERSPYRRVELKVPCTRCNREILEREADLVLEGSGYRCWRCTLAMETDDHQDRALVRLQQTRRTATVGRGVYLAMWVIGAALCWLLLVVLLGGRLLH